MLPEDGLVCIARIGPQKGAPCIHDVYSTIDEALTALPKFNSSKDNIYFAVSTLAERSVMERGKLRVRTQKNSKSTRCIILDVDIKEKEGYYHEKDEAWEGIQNITAQLNLPDPIIVDSGFGYHVYWPMMAGIPSADWRATAKLFYQALLIIEPRAVKDASRVSDSASVLRVPETLNLKNGRETPVGIVQWFSGHLDYGDFKDKLRRITGSNLVGVAPGGDGAPLVSLDTPREYEKVSLQATAKNCNWVRTYITNMAQATEPEWYAMLGLAPYMEHTTKDGIIINGPDIAHLLSKGHPEYDPAATDKKFNQVSIAQTGPTTCGKMQQVNATPCQTCPFRNAVKTPVATARLDRPATTVQTKIALVTEEGDKKEEQIDIPLPPSPYFRGESGGVYVRSKEQAADGTWTEVINKIYDYDLYPVKRYRSELNDEEHLEINLWLPKDGMVRFRMPTEYLVEHKRTGAYLASRGALAEMGGTPRLAKYLIDYTRSIQTKESAEMEYARFGWRNVETDNPVFVVGNGIIDSTGAIKPAAFPAYLKKPALAVAAHGDFNKWKDAFNVYRGIPNSEPLILAAMMAFAAPAMALTAYAGAMYNMLGKSGAGKSASMQIMSSVWGQPNENHISTKDTVIAMTNTIGYHNSIPVAFDELTHMDPAIAADFALLFTGGRGKNRADRSGQNKENNVSWNTIVVCSSNSSIYEKFNDARKGYNAEAMRVFEVKVPPANPKYKDQMDVALKTLRENYGLAGRMFIPAVMRNKQAIAKAIEIQAARIMQQIGGTTSERFWINLVATVYVTGSIAKKMGLHDYDMEALLRWCLNEMDVVREATGESAVDPVGMLGEFVNRNINNMVRIRNGSVDLRTSSNIVSIMGRLEYIGDKLIEIIVSHKALQDWCNHSKIDMSFVMTGLKDRGITTGRNESKRLATGTNLPNVPVRSYVMRVAGTPLEDIQDGQSAPTDQGVQGTEPSGN